MIYKELGNNGQFNDSINFADSIFGETFTLAPEETIYCTVGVFGETCENGAFPYVKINVSYHWDVKRKRIEYSRTVIYSRSPENVGTIVDPHLNSHLKSISHSSVRIANYMDGCSLTSQDEIEVLAHNSLKSDLSDAIQQK